MAHADLVRFSFAADLVQATFAVFLVMALYRLLRHVQPSMARAMVVFVVLQVGITCLNLVHQFGALMVATQPSYSNAFGDEGTNTLVLLLMELQHNGYLVAQIFFGLWLFPLGLLAYRSGMFPRALGVILMLATGAYLIDAALQFLAPTSPTWCRVPSDPGRDRCRGLDDGLPVGHGLPDAGRRNRSGRRPPARQRLICRDRCVRAGPAPSSPSRPAVRASRRPAGTRCAGWS